MCLSDKRIVHHNHHLFLVPGHGPGYDGFNADVGTVGQLNCLAKSHHEFHRSTIGLGLSKKCSYDDNYYCYCSNSRISSLECGYLSY